MSEHEHGTDVAVMEDPERVAQLLSGLAELEITDSSEINAAQVRHILLAESEEEAFAEVPTMSSVDLEGVALHVDDLVLLPSKYNGGKGAFVAATCVRIDTGEQVILTTSAARVAARLVWLKMHDRLPRDVVITCVTEATANGRKVLGLELVG